MNVLSGDCVAYQLFVIGKHLLRVDIALLRSHTCLSCYRTSQTLSQHWQQLCLPMFTWVSKKWGLVSSMQFTC